MGLKPKCTQLFHDVFTSRYIYIHERYKSILKMICYIYAYGVCCLLCLACDADYYGINCEEECSDGCEDPCSIMAGTCSCKDWWKGSKCDIEIRELIIIVWSDLFFRNKYLGCVYMNGCILKQCSVWEPRPVICLDVILLLSDTVHNNVGLFRTNVLHIQ